MGSRGRDGLFRRGGPSEEGMGTTGVTGDRPYGEEGFQGRLGGENQLAENVSGLQEEEMIEIPGKGKKLGELPPI